MLYWSKEFMSKVIPNKLSIKKRKELKRLLFIKITKLKNIQEVKDFFEDLLTESEFVMIIRRLEIAKLLLDELPYWQIRQELGVGYDTIKLVRNKLVNGAGGYERFIRELKA